MIKLYKDGNRMGVGTDCDDEDQFTREFSALISRLIESKDYDGDWEFQFEGWLPCFIDIVCRLRGYKTPEVHEKTWFHAGYGEAPLVAQMPERADGSGVVAEINEVEHPLEATP